MQTRDFDWMNSGGRAFSSARQREAMYTSELIQRAALLRRLGYTQARTVARLNSNVAWDFEVGTSGRPASLSLAALKRIVKAAYAT